MELFKNGHNRFERHRTKRHFHYLTWKPSNCKSFYAKCPTFWKISRTASGVSSSVYPRWKTQRAVIVTFPGIHDGLSFWRLLSHFNIFLYRFSVITPLYQSTVWLSRSFDQRFVNIARAAGGSRFMVLLVCRRLFPVASSFFWKRLLIPKSIKS